MTKFSIKKLKNLIRNELLVDVFAESIDVKILELESELQQWREKRNSLRYNQNLVSPSRCYLNDCYDEILRELVKKED